MPLFNKHHSTGITHKDFIPAKDWMERKGEYQIHHSGNGFFELSYTVWEYTLCKGLHYWEADALLNALHELSLDDFVFEVHFPKMRNRFRTKKYGIHNARYKWAEDNTDIQAWFKDMVIAVRDDENHVLRR